MAIEWFDKECGSDIGVSKEDASMLLIGVGKPEVVRVPDDTGFGGVYRCLELVVRACPIANHTHNCIHYVLTDGIGVAECCESKVFIWYRVR